ncbi:uncharacterized, partial [Tachysurus ichikawai]
LRPGDEQIFECDADEDFPRGLSVSQLHLLTGEGSTKPDRDASQKDEICSCSIELHPFSLRTELKRWFKRRRKGRLETKARLVESPSAHVSALMVAPLRTPEND